MENLQTLIEQIKTDIQNEKSDEEIFQSLFLLLEKETETWGRLAESLGAIPDEKIGRLLHRMFEGAKEKKVRKMIKRSLYRLKNKGIAVEKIESDKESPVFRPLQKDPNQGLASGRPAWDRQ